MAGSGAPVHVKSEGKAAPDAFYLHKYPKEMYSKYSKGDEFKGESSYLNAGPLLGRDRDPQEAPGPNAPTAGDQQTLNGSSALGVDVKAKAEPVSPSNLLGGAPPLTSPHVQSLSTLCPPFPEAHVPSLASSKDDLEKSKCLCFLILFYWVGWTIAQNRNKQINVEKQVLRFY